MYYARVYHIILYYTIKRVVAEDSLRVLRSSWLWGLRFRARAVLGVELQSAAKPSGRIMIRAGPQSQESLETTGLQRTDTFREPNVEVSFLAALGLRMLGFLRFAAFWMVWGFRLTCTALSSSSS